MQAINLDKLIKILKAEYQLYQEIYGLGEEKQEAVMADDIDSLENRVKYMLTFAKKGWFLIIIIISKMRQNLYKKSLT